jgi:hypothetical protein
MDISSKMKLYLFRYPKIWRDPDLSFSKIIPQIAEIATDDDAMKLEAADQGDVDDDHDHDLEKDEEPDQDDEMDIDHQSDPIEQEGNENTKDEPMKPDTLEGAQGIPIPSAEGPTIYVPSPTELGLRIRKILSGLTRIRSFAGKEDGRRGPRESRGARQGKEDSMSKKSRLGKPIFISFD